MAIKAYDLAGAAELLNIHKRTVGRLVAEHDLGLRVNARSIVLTEADIETLRGLVRPRGNPEWTKKKAAKKKAAKPRKKK